MGQPVKLFVGLDISSFDMKVCILRDEGEKLIFFTVSNNLLDVIQLRDRILDCTVDKISFKTSIGIYIRLSFSSIIFLPNDESLKSLDAKVLVINSKQITNFKKAIQILCMAKLKCRVWQCV